MYTTQYLLQSFMNATLAATPRPHSSPLSTINLSSKPEVAEMAARCLGTTLGIHSERQTVSAYVLQLWLSLSYIRRSDAEP